MCCPMMLFMMMLLVVTTSGNSAGCRVTMSSTAYQKVHGVKYLQLSAKDKLKIIIKNCLENTTPADWFSTFKMLGLFTQSMCPTLTHRGDEMMEDRNKYIHTVGAVAQVKWEDLGGHNYTGIFTGADHGIARLSVAKEVDEDNKVIVPGMGLKFLRDGMESVNLVAMHSLDGQKSWNFFKNHFSNHIGSGSLSSFPIKASVQAETPG